MKVLDNFLYAEQILNNYSLYGEDMKDYFNIHLPEPYMPSNQKKFPLPYFIVPASEDKIIFKSNEEDFFNENLFLEYKSRKCYRFFVHPTTKKLFLDWINKKYDFVDEDKSEYIALTLSSFRSLSVTNVKTKEMFIIKLSLLNNVANGARHIDWNSAVGQYEASQMTVHSAKNLENLRFFEDIGAFGLTGERALYLSERFDVRIGSRKIQTFGNVIRKLPSDFFIETTDRTVCSLASYTSLLRQEGSYISLSYKNSGLSPLDFLDSKIFSPIFELLVNLMKNQGIVLEPHCQNMIIELGKTLLPTGKLYYRDFDLTTFDRARFTFFHKENFRSYIEKRPDRTILFSNLSMRENIGIGFFVHFLGNLIKPCLVSLQKENKNNLPKNILNRDFESDRPLKKLCTDVSYFKTTEGWLYLSPILDLYGRKIVCRAISNHNDDALANSTLDNLFTLNNLEGALLHSDQGVLYTSKNWRKRLEKNGLIQSMSRRGNCWDNACMEHFFGTLKVESGYDDLLKSGKILSFEETKKLIDDFIEYYNNERIQQNLGWKTPSEAAA